MAYQLLKDTVLHEPVNGLVSDAAHGYWRMSNWLLIISYVYSHELHAWNPTIFSVTDGGTKEHYHIHFLALFTSLAKECEQHGEKIIDRLFAVVMDFSEAEAGGFVKAFIDFWLAQDDNTRSPEELELVAKALLKGCEQHFHTGVTCLKKISAVVKPSLADAFETRAFGLLDAEDMSSFNKRANAVIRDFPHAQNWLTWW
jgi:hypothetical protein